MIFKVIIYFLPTLLNVVSLDTGVTRVMEGHTACLWPPCRLYWERILTITCSKRRGLRCTEQRGELWAESLLNLALPSSLKGLVSRTPCYIGTVKSQVDVKDTDWCDPCLFMCRTACGCLCPGIWTAPTLSTSSSPSNSSPKVPWNSAIQKLELINTLFLSGWCLNRLSCGLSPGVPERSHSVLLQYSVNGGISWLMLDEFYFPASTDTLFLHLPLPASAQTNATRFRLWQPYNSGEWTLCLVAHQHSAKSFFV